MYNLNEAIGKRIAKLRKDRDLTQEELAEQLNCSIKHVSHVERGVASFSLDLLIDVSRILDCSLDYLIKGEEAMPEDKLPSSIRYILSSRDERMEKERELLLAYLKMYNELRKQT